MKRLLIVSTNFPPSISIGTQRILRISKYLDPSQWQVSVLTLKEHYYPDMSHRTDDDKGDILNKINIHRAGKIDPVESILKLRESFSGNSNGNQNNSGIAKAAPKKKEPGKNGKANYSEKIKAKQKQSIWGQIKDFATGIMQFPDKNVTFFPLALMRGYRIIKKEKVDVIFSSSPPHSMHLITVWLKKLTGKRLVVDFRDPWARSPWHDEERELNRFEQWKHNKIVTLEKWVVEHADKVVLVTKEMRDDYVRHYDYLPADKFIWFSNGYDPDTVQPNAMYRNGKTEAPEKVKFIHAGSLYKYRDPTNILKALKLLVENDEIDRSRIEFLFIGGINTDQAHIPQMTKEMGIDDMVNFMPPVSYNAVMEYMVASHIPILLQPVTRLQLPGKFFDYLCLQKPILAVAEPESATKHMVEEHFGIFGDVNKVEDVAKAIKFLYNNPFYNFNKIEEKREQFNMAKSIHTFQEILNV